jgi:hypothetical protein
MRGGNSMRRAIGVGSAVAVCLWGVVATAQNVVGGEGYYVLRGDGFPAGEVESFGVPEEYRFFSDLFLPIDILGDMELTLDETGFPTGMIVLDGFGAEFSIGDAPEYDPLKRPYWFDPRDPRVLDPIEDPNLPPDFVFPAAVSIAFARDDAGSTQPEVPLRDPGANGFAGYYVLDNYGGIHVVNNNVPDRNPWNVDPTAYDQDPKNIFFRKYEEFYTGFPLYWLGLDIARDLEVSVRFTPQSGGQTNGYYLMDMAGAVHTCLGIGAPAPWQDLPRPYFTDGSGNPADMAVDFEVVPRQDGYVLLDRYGNLYFVGPGAEQYRDNEDIPRRFTPVFGPPLDIMTNVELVTSGMIQKPGELGPDEGMVTGLYVIDEFGIVYNAGLAPYFGGPVPVGGPPLYHDIEVSPGARALSDAFQNNV